jgi:predicted glycoside hydrolase/deacetylase ChbG (UPF0249 family)
MGLCLIINADDLGYSKKRDDGIFKCFSEGVVTSASLLVNGASAHSALITATELNFPTGLHFNLTEGTPILNQSSSLTESSHKSDVSKRVFMGKMGFRKAIDDSTVSAIDIEAELVAQIELYKSFHPKHHLPIHVDGHQHIQVIPIVAECMANVMNRYGITKVRLPSISNVAELEEMTSLPPSRLSFYTCIDEQAVLASSLYQSRSIRAPDVFLGYSTMGKDCTRDRICRLLTRLLDVDDPSVGSNRVVEWMVHPGYPLDPILDSPAGCGEGADEFSQSSDRLVELDLLLDPILKTWFEEHAISLVNYTILDKNIESV